jgi:hypothetical protein
MPGLNFIEFSCCSLLPPFFLLAKITIHREKRRRTAGEVIINLELIMLLVTNYKKYHRFLCLKFIHYFLLMPGLNFIEFSCCSLLSPSFLLVKRTIHSEKIRRTAGEVIINLELIKLLVTNYKKYHRFLCLKFMHYFLLMPGLNFIEFSCCSLLSPSFLLVKELFTGRK